MGFTWVGEGLVLLRIKGCERMARQGFRCSSIDVVILYYSGKFYSEG